ncbi:hypothetical protein JB92DRAFT_359122 [Gautieria morchelliformis]|nr:hypothetical protein JB92DRAFT_359122 [Gautieria morchelliformis]
MEVDCPATDASKVQAQRETNHISVTASLDEIRRLIGKSDSKGASQQTRTKSYRKQVTTTSHAASARQQKARSNSRVVDLKSECKSKGLPIGGKKADLVLRLREHEAVEGRKMQIDIVCEEGHAVDEADDAELDYLIVNSTTQKEAEELGQSFLSGLNKFSSVENNHHGPDDSEDEDDGSSDEAATIVTAVKMDCVTASKVADTFAWVDKYILEC